MSVPVHLHACSQGGGKTGDTGDRARHAVHRRERDVAIARGAKAEHEVRTQASVRLAPVVAKVPVVGSSGLVAHVFRAHPADLERRGLIGVDETHFGIRSHEHADVDPPTE